MNLQERHLPKGTILKRIADGDDKIITVGTNYTLTEDKPEGSPNVVHLNDHGNRTVRNLENYTLVSLLESNNELFPIY